MEGCHCRQHHLSLLLNVRHLELDVNNHRCPGVALAARAVGVCAQDQLALGVDRGCGGHNGAELDAAHVTLQDAEQRCRRGGARHRVRRRAREALRQASHVAARDTHGGDHMERRRRPAQGHLEPDAGSRMQRRIKAVHAVLGSREAQRHSRHRPRLPWWLRRRRGCHQGRRVHHQAALQARQLAGKHRGQGLAVPVGG